jgi:hypothetical protein
MIDDLKFAALLFVIFAAIIVLNILRPRGAAVGQ